jgi:hAT family C-terminal dimerisation region
MLAASGKAGVLVSRADMAENRSSTSRVGADGQTVISHHTRWNPKSVWFLYFDTAPVISHAAVAILSVAGSEAAVERSFSAQDAVHTKKRNRLLDNTVEQEMFIKFNTHALKRRPAEREQGAWIELDEKMEEVEEVPRLSGLFSREAKAAEQKDRAESKEEKEEVQESSPAAVISQIDPPPPSVDDVQRFIVQYVSEHRIHARFRWQEHHMANLSNAAVRFQPSLKDTDVVLRKKIMAYVRAEQLLVDAATADTAPNV